MKGYSLTFSFLQTMGRDAEARIRRSRDHIVHSLVAVLVRPRRLPLGFLVSPSAICRSASRLPSAIRRSASWCRRGLGVILGDSPLGVFVSPSAIRRSASRCRPWRFAARRLGVALGDSPLGVGNYGIETRQQSQDRVETAELGSRQNGRAATIRRSKDRTAAA